MDLETSPTWTLVKKASLYAESYRTTENKLSWAKMDGQQITLRSFFSSAFEMQASGSSVQHRWRAVIFRDFFIEKKIIFSPMCSLITKPNGVMHNAFELFESS